MVTELLGDIPILGKLFTTTRTDTHRTDLVIIITPRLVQGPNEYVPCTVTPIPGGAVPALGWPAVSPVPSLSTSPALPLMPVTPVVPAVPAKP